MNQLQVMWAIVKKDLSIWIRSPATIIVTIVPALVLLLVLILGAAAVTGSPVAIVNDDSGGVAAQKFVQIAKDYDGFYGAKIMIPANAEIAYEKLQVAGILTVPPNFSTDIAAGRKPVIEWQIRNFNDDTANDLRRALPDIMDEFMKSGTVGLNPIHTTIDEQDLHKTDASFVGFNLIAILSIDSSIRDC